MTSIVIAVLAWCSISLAIGGMMIWRSVWDRTTQDQFGDLPGHLFNWE